MMIRKKKLKILDILSLQKSYIIVIHFGVINGKILLIVLGNRFVGHMINLENTYCKKKKKKKGTEESGIRTHAPEGTGALNQRLGPLGHLSAGGNTGKAQRPNGGPTVGRRQAKGEQTADQLRPTVEPPLAYRRFVIRAALAHQRL